MEHVIDKDNSMKKNSCIILILSMAIMLVANGQNIVGMPKPIINSVEFMIGPSSVGLRGNPLESTRTSGGGNFISTLATKTGYSLGIGLSNEVSKHFMFTVRCLWEKKGYIEGLDSITLNGTYNAITSRSSIWTKTIDNSYLTATLLPQLVLGEKYRFIIGAGGYFGFLITSRTQWNQQNIYSYSYASNQAYNKFDFGLSFDTGFSYPVNRNLRLTLHFNTNFGISHISDWLVSFNYPKWYNNSYCVLLGLRFTKITQNYFKL
jgi:hypothetical protein